MRPIFLAGFLLLILPTPALAQLTNGSFESGLTGWTQLGNVGTVTSSFRKTPVDGARMAYMVSQNTPVPGITTTGDISAASLASGMGTTTTAFNNAAGPGNSTTTGAGATGGSGIFRSFNVAANTTLFFDWTFMTAEDPVFSPGSFQNDYGFMVLNGNVTALGRLNKIASDPFETSAFHYIPFTNTGGLDGSTVESFLYEVGDGTGNATTRANDAQNNGNTNFGAAKYKRFGISFFTAQTVNLGFGVMNVHSGGSGDVPSAFLVDNVRLVNGVIPEPGTIVLLALGGLGGLVFLRRR